MRLLNKVLTLYTCDRLCFLFTTFYIRASQLSYIISTSYNTLYLLQKPSSGATATGEVGTHLIVFINAFHRGIQHDLSCH